MVYYLTEELVSMGHDVTLFGTADSKTSATLVPMWPKAISSDAASRIRDIGWYADLAVSQVLDHAHDFDIIHDHTYFVAGRYGHLVTTPVVTTMHHPVSFETGLIDDFPPEYRTYAQLQDQYHLQKITTVAVSKFQQNELKEKLARESHVVHNGIPTTEWQNPNVSAPGSYIAFLGYMSGNKGVAEAIKAVLQTDEILHIAGPIDSHDDKTQAYFDTQVKPFIDNRKIHYLGGIDRKEKLDFLRNAKAILMPIQWDEPFGLVAIESLAMGTPVIAYNRGALPEIIEDGVSGYLVTSIEHMAAKIKKVDQLLRSNSRMRYETMFTSRRMGERYVDIYKTLISQKQTSA